MGLKDLIPDDVGESRGGRPAEGIDGPPKQLHGEPFMVSNDSEEYWRSIWDRFVSGDEPTPEEIGQMADHTHLFPWDLRIYLEKWGIFDFDWEQIPEDYPTNSFLVQMLEEEGVENDFTEAVRAEQEGYSRDSGLFGLVENARRERED